MGIVTSVRRPSFPSPHPRDSYLGFPFDLPETTPGISRYQSTSALFASAITSSLANPRSSRPQSAEAVLPRITSLILRLVRHISQGYACPNEDCGVRLHTFCVAQRLGNNGRCPDRLDDKPNPCPQIWPRDPQTRKCHGVPIGIAALGLEDDEESDAGATSDVETGAGTPAAMKKKGKGAAAKGKKAAASGKKGKKRTKADGDEEEEDELDDDEESDADASGRQRASSSPAGTRESSRTAKKKRTVQSDDDDDAE
ncbi:hypothetical protein AAT19DRAFT_8856 [Rhodotorula toruloides]|uniref:Non-structural maintenance of chromosomes element 1 RING C4HC3-type domain-containing protein n=1 Tax=Rhodotorula toruloides TaxID=5286 RepID=A0A2T0AIE9_RHOTO|nr:hypothetical protein AAT19DRAFT_8856 [Rhodotorula toruloides]